MLSKSKKFIVMFILFLLIGLGWKVSTDNEKDSDWEVEDVYGNWKVTQLIGRYKGTRGNLSYGNNIGRSFIITEEKIIDSTSLERAIEEADEQRSFNMDIGCFSESKFDVSTSEGLQAFLKSSDIILYYAGITENHLSEFIFLADQSEENNPSDDYHLSPMFSVLSFSQENKDILVVDLPLGYYLMERFKEQEKVKNPYGLWMVERMVARGNGEQFGIDFFDEYGRCFEISADAIKEGKETSVKIRWDKKVVNKAEFEKEYEIKEGLGIENSKLEVWYGEGENDFNIQLVPVNENEIIIPIEGQWYLLTRIPEYEEPKEDIQPILKGDWKVAQLLAIGDVNEEIEICGRTDYKAWWYTTSVSLDESSYQEGILSDWTIETYEASVFFEQFAVPENITCMFGDDDLLHIAIRTVYDIEEIYIVLDEDTIIRGRNGLWYKLNRVNFET